MDLLRSLIFVPGNRPSMLEKARQFDADVLVADLEDSVPPGEKQRARETVAEVAPTMAGRGQKIMVRVNSLDTGLAQGDLVATIGPHLYGFSVGKIETPWDIQEFDRIIAALETQAGVPSGSLVLVPWIENAKAVMTAREIATASARVVAVAFGAEDYADDMDIQRTDSGEEVSFARALVPVAAKAAGVLALDSPYVGFRDEAGLKVETELNVKLGYKGKFAIHPAQLDIINASFAPRGEDVEYARRVMEAWDMAVAQGRGSTSLDGRMIDVPVVKRARSLLDQVEAMDRGK